MGWQRQKRRAPIAALFNRTVAIITFFLITIATAWPTRILEREASAR
jgi:hypothetical protein